MRPAPFRFASMALVVLLTLVSTSCLIVSRYSLIDPLKSKPDERLRGRWIGTGELVDFYALFDGGTSLETNILAGKEPYSKPDLMFDVFTGPIGKYQYMSLRQRDVTTGREFLLARYTIDGDEMKVWLLDSTLISAAISQRKLKSAKGSSTTTLTDSPKKLAAFVVANEESKELLQFLGTFKKTGE